MAAFFDGSVENTKPHDPQALDRAPIQELQSRTSEEVLAMTFQLALYDTGGSNE